MYIKYIVVVVFLVNGLKFAVIARKQKDKNTTKIKKNKTFKTKNLKIEFSF